MLFQDSSVLALSIWTENIKNCVHKDVDERQVFSTVANRPSPKITHDPH